MSEVHISDTSASLERANKILAGIGNGNSVMRAVASAAKRAAQSGRAKAGQFASDRYFISSGGFKGHVKDKIKVNGGGAGATSVSIEFAGTVIPLIEFNTSFSRAGGVTAHVKKGGGGPVNHAFIARIGRTSVYERTTTKRFPVEKKYSVSAAHMMMDETVEANMDKQITSVFEERMEHEITRILNGW